jgi:hypothetical protein
MSRRSGPAYNHCVTKEPKVTVESLATGEVYKQFGQVSENARSSRPDLGEMPIVYVTNRKKDVLGIVPAWVAKWVEANAAQLLADYQAEHPDES